MNCTDTRYEQIAELPEHLRGLATMLSKGSFWVEIIWIESNWLGFAY